jgi:hypothetical protein|tara:strand:+ start:367 stop:597 length:231 start_codon:yes stop_codon:yes gene_type:complete
MVKYIYFTLTYKGVCMSIKEQCSVFNIRLTDIAEDTGFTLPYVHMVVSGKRSNTQILSAVHLAIHDKKKLLKTMIS